MRILRIFFAGGSWPVEYGYDCGGELTTVTYLCGPQVVQSYDPIGRLSELQTAGTNYLS